MSDIRLIQLNNYVRPVVKEEQSKDWVLNGKNNSFYQYIIDRYNGSTTNAAIINSYIDMVYGQGLGSKNASLMMGDWLKVNMILKPMELRKIVSDFVLYNEFSFQVIKAKNGKDLASILHLPKERVVPNKENEDEEIVTYWYSKDWKQLNKFKPIPFSAFGESNDNIEIYVGRPYKAGKTYYSDPDYLASLPYAEMEEEISNYCINHIKNGLSFGYIINIPDGKSLTSEEKDILERKIKEKLTGSNNAGKFVLSFNGRDAEITVTALQVNDAHKQWQFLTEESRQQIMTGHRVVSPMLFGIKDNTGFGNNADELDTAREQLIKYVIEPKQKFIIDALEHVFLHYGLALDLYFKPLTYSEPKPIVQLSKQLTIEDFGELISDIELEYELESCEPVNYEDDLYQLASTGTARGNAKSNLDGADFITRFRYAGNQSPEREFCRKMMSANKIYRKEDIDAMGNITVNPGFGMHPNPNEPYSIWLYKGGGLLSDTFPGGTCKHYWEKLVYRKKGLSKIDVNNPNAEDLISVQAPARGKAGIAPHEMT